MRAREAEAKFGEERERKGGKSGEKAQELGTEGERMKQEKQKKNFKKGKGPKDKTTSNCFGVCGLSEQLHIPF